MADDPVVVISLGIPPALSGTPIISQLLKNKEASCAADRSKSRERGLVNNSQKLRHSRWECKYHVVWIARCRRKVLYGELRSHLSEVFHNLARQKQSEIFEGLLQTDYVHMLVAIPPKYAGSQVIEYMKGKSAIPIARTYLGQRKNYVEMSWWPRGYFVSTVGADEKVVRAYIREQEKEDKRVDQVTLFKEATSE